MDDMQRSQTGVWIAAPYLLLVLIVCLPLIKDGAIHHGNGIAFLAAMIITFPLSWLLFWLIDSFTNQPFYTTGLPYLLDMSALIFSAIVNAGFLYFLPNIWRKLRGTPSPLH